MLETNFVHKCEQNFLGQPVWYITTQSVGGSYRQALGVKQLQSVQMEQANYCQLSLAPTSSILYTARARSLNLI